MERPQKTTPATSADNILASLTEVYDQVISSAGIDPVASDELDAGEMDEQVIDVDEDTRRQSAPEKITKKKMHDFILKTGGRLNVNPRQNNPVPP